ncbi:OadG family protein [uncultured Megamonas sp.]|uniref:OadG family protein n=1 Tax=uncultured Megamonas sp. TaxID=286140 RepID=UPI0025CE62A8|nr:OadG family protein [uncultured Megamonas sp.]
MDAPNPILIMVINMTIVFVVLYILGLFIRLIHVVDPTRKRKVEPKKEEVKTTSPVQIPKDDMADKTLAAIIVTSLMAYGCKDFEIKSIKKL